MKICILSSGRSPFDERLFYKIALSLRKTYSNITIVSPYEKATDTVEGINISGIPARKSRWNRIAVWRNLYRTALKENADVYQCEELDSWFIGWLLKKRLECKLIFDSHECNVATISQGIPKIFRGIAVLAVFILEKILIKQTDHLFVANQIVRGYYCLLNRFASISILYNVPVLKIFEEYDCCEEDSYDLCHEGNLNFGRGLKEMINVLIRLKKKHPKIRLLIVGEVYGEEKDWLNKKMIQNDIANNIVITGWLDYKVVGKQIAKCQIGIIAMLPLPNNMLAGQPNKLFNYMRYGLAVVAPDFPEVTRVIEEEKCGIVFSSGNEEQLFETIESLITHKALCKEMGTKGKKAVRDVYCWEKMEEPLYNAYQKLSKTLE